ncbi:MAG: hypothetical protein JJU07_10220 [Natronohydrobacter sp.]|nr:hypothetical protein [Natronohydrobacter sp.]
MKSRLDDMSEATRAELLAMTPDQVRDLSYDVHIDRMHARQAAYPSDPKEALSGMRGLVRGSMEIEIDDHVQHVMSTLVMLRLALIPRGNDDGDLDRIDLSALVYFIDDAIRILRDHDQRVIELCERMRQVEYPLKK